MAFSIYGTEFTLGRLLCLVLGICTAATVALYICSQVIEYIRRKIDYRTQTSKYLIFLRHSLHLLSSTFVLGPAVVNLIFVFVWRNSPDSRYNLHNRCHIDIDSIWSVEHNFCIAQSPAWGIWISIAAVRAAVTLLALVSASMYFVMFDLSLNRFLLDWISYCLFYIPRNPSPPHTPEAPC
jgi:hypothetical protein